jgi:predicted nucleotidyltransferase
MRFVIETEAMHRAEIIDKLKAVEPKLRAHGVAALYLFGSHAREEGREDSDIDVFVDKTPGRRFGLDAFLGAYTVLRNTFPGVEVGYTTREGLVDSYRPYIEQGAIRVF